MRDPIAADAYARQAERQLDDQAADLKAARERIAELEADNERLETANRVLSSQFAARSCLHGCQHKARPDAD